MTRKDIEIGIESLRDEVKSLQDAIYRSKNGTLVGDSIGERLTSLEDAVIALWNYVNDNLDPGEQVSIDTTSINDWKDIVIAALPAGASVAMANDVEEALDKFNSVY